MGRPLLIVDPIPGQEAANSDFLLERGAAAKANRVEDLPLVRALSAQRNWQTWRKRQRRGRPKAAQAICKIVNDWRHDNVGLRRP
jgi:hypothetical protein